MPIYKNRLEMPANTELRRYMTLDGLSDVLRNQRLRLRRIDKFDDPFEGAVPKRQIDDQVPLFSSRNGLQMESIAAHFPGMNLPPRRWLDAWTEMTQRRRAMTRSAHASCWVAGPESEAMWRLYGQENICDVSTLGHTVALQSTLGKIESSLTLHDLFVSPIRYRTYHEGDAFDDDLDMFMHKRLGFRHECEVRFLKYDRGHRDQLMNALINDSPPPPELPEHVHLGLPLNSVVESILISPYADEAYEEKVRAEMKLIDSDYEKLLALSILSERRFAPQF